VGDSPSIRPGSVEGRQLSEPGRPIGGGLDRPDWAPVLVA
jgi:hypothetical protein